MEQAGISPNHGSPACGAVVFLCDAAYFIDFKKAPDSRALGHPAPPVAVSVHTGDVKAGGRARIARLK
jgi:hypothetical protein